MTEERFNDLERRLRLLEEFEMRHKQEFELISYAEPSKPRELMIRFADGASWDPGQGRGLYQYVLDEWTLLNNGPMAWQDATLLNSWVNFGGAERPVQYARDKNYNVLLRGTAKNGTIVDATTILNLPAGYRPPSPITIPVAQVHGAQCRFVVNSSGNVDLYGMSSNSFIYVYFEFSLL